MVLRLYHVLLGCTVLALAPLGMKFTNLYTSSPGKSQPAPIARPHVNQTPSLTASSTTLNLTEGNIWRNILGTTVTPPNWQVAPCQDNAFLLCVTSQAKRLGTVEMGVYPLGQQLDFQEMLITAGVPLTAKVNYQDPKYQTQISKALKAWIAQHYTEILKDHQTSNGHNITFSQRTLQQVAVGKLPGIRYEFIGHQPQGTVYEQYLGYITFDGTALYVITTAFNPTLNTGKFETLEDFQRFEPHLSKIVANLKLRK
jgi:hypothetical protein